MFFVFWFLFSFFSLGLDFENVETEKLHLYNLAHSGLDIFLEILDIIFVYLEGLFVFLCYIPICALFLKSKNSKIIKKKKSNKKKFDHKVALKTHKIHNATFE